MASPHGWGRAGKYLQTQSLPQEKRGNLVVSPQLLVKSQIGYCAVSVTVTLLLVALLSPLSEVAVPVRV